jgi:GAF domain-containing protein
MRTLERIIDKLDLKEFQLRALLDITKAINNNLGRQELLKLYEKIVRQDLGITRLMLFERAEGWKNILAYGPPHAIWERTPSTCSEASRRSR